MVQYIGSATSPITSWSGNIEQNKCTIYVPKNTAISLTLYVDVGGGSLYPFSSYSSSVTNLTNFTQTNSYPANITFTSQGVDGSFEWQSLQTINGTITITVVSTYAHSIGYNANGGSGSMNASVVIDTNSGNTNVTFASNGFTAPTGKYFAGWKINNTGTTYQPGNTYAIGGNASVIAYAQWATYTYTVTFASNNTGYGTVSPTSIAYDEDVRNA